MQFSPLFFSNINSRGIPEEKKNVAFGNTKYLFSDIINVYFAPAAAEDDILTADVTLEILPEYSKAEEIFPEAVNQETKDEVIESYSAEYLRIPPIDIHSPDVVPVEIELSENSKENQDSEDVLKADMFSITFPGNDKPQMDFISENVLSAYKLSNAPETNILFKLSNTPNLNTSNTPEDLIPGNNNSADLLEPRNVDECLIHSIFKANSAGEVSALQIESLPLKDEVVSVINNILESKFGEVNTSKVNGVYKINVKGDPDNEGGNSPKNFLMVTREMQSGKLINPNKHFMNNDPSIADDAGKSLINNVLNNSIEAETDLNYSKAFQISELIPDSPEIKNKDIQLPLNKHLHIPKAESENNYSLLKIYQPKSEEAAHFKNNYDETSPIYAGNTFKKLNTEIKNSIAIPQSYEIDFKSYSNPTSIGKRLPDAEILSFKGFENTNAISGNELSLNFPRASALKKVEAILPEVNIFQKNLRDNEIQKSNVSIKGKENNATETDKISSGTNQRLFDLQDITQLNKVFTAGTGNLKELKIDSAQSGSIKPSLADDYSIELSQAGSTIIAEQKENELQTAFNIKNYANSSQTEVYPLNNEVKNVLQKHELSVKFVNHSELIKEISSFTEQIGKTSITLKLLPEELGNVKVSLDIQDKVVNAKIEVETESVRQTVQNNSEVLKTNLQQQGIQLASLNIVLSGNEQKSGKPQYHKRKFGNEKTVSSFKKSEMVTKSFGYNTYEYLV